MTLLRILAISVTLFAGLVAAPSAQASSAPQLGKTWVTDVSASSASFHGEVEPNGLSTTYRFEYITDAAYQENVAAAREPFTGAARAPAGGAAPVGAGSSYITVFQHVSALRAGTTYHYRLAATNSSGTTLGPARVFRTQSISGGFELPDGRGYEMVSPVEKNGGAIQGPERNHDGGVFEAAASGGGITYSSASSFGEEALGAPPASQYISRLQGAGDWRTEDISSPVVSGSYGNEPNGVPYQLFSTDLERAVMLNGIHCRGEGTNCPVANPPLPGSEAPNGYQDYYLRDDQGGAYTALVTTKDAPSLDLNSSQFNVSFSGASSDLRHVILSTCAKLTPNATEVTGSDGCNPEDQNLYEYSSGQLSLINLLPGQTQGTPGAQLGAQGGAVSADGSRVYFTDGGHLYLREGSSTKQLDESLGTGGRFETATPDGQVAFFTTEEGSGEEHLYRYRIGGSPESIAAKVRGVLGASEDGSSIYFQDAVGLKQWHEGAIAQVASGAEAAAATNWPPTTGTARVSSDGTELLFLSTESLTGYDNTDQTTGQPDSEVFLWRTAGGSLACLSCNPSGERPLGPSTIPGALANGKGTTDLYKPRDLSANGQRIFFDSQDALAAFDTNQRGDVYEWEAQGNGSCEAPEGCLFMVSNGKDPEGASFIDASESGADAFFLTYEALVEKDPGYTNSEKVAGAADIYDARIGGHEPPLPVTPECEGDNCTFLPPEPEDPTVGSLIPGPGNPPVHFPASHGCAKGKHPIVRHGKTICVKTHKRGHPGGIDEGIHSCLCRFGDRDPGNLRDSRPGRHELRLQAGP